MARVLAILATVYSTTSYLQYSKVLLLPTVRLVLRQVDTVVHMIRHTSYTMHHECVLYYCSLR